MLTVRVTWHRIKSKTGKPTVYEVLRDKLRREPTHAELKADVLRIFRESTAELAAKGKLPHQRKR